MTLTNALNSIGGVKTALKAMALGPEFEAALRAVEALFADGLPLPRLEAVFTTEKSVLPAYPALELLGPTSQPDPEASLQEYTHTVVAVFTQIGTEEELLTAQVERYVLAWRTMVFQQRFVPFLGNAPVVLGREDYSPLGYHRELDRMLVKQAAIELFVKTFSE